MTRRRYGESDFAFGLTWLAPGVVPPNSSKSRKIKELKNIKPAPVGYVETNTLSGLQIGTTIDTDDLGLVSAAATLAQSQSSAVLIEKLSDDEFWLCAIEDGAVFPAGDIFGSKDLIANRLEEIQSDIKGTDIRLFADQDQFDVQGAESLGFLDLISEALLDRSPQCLPIEHHVLRKPIKTFAISLLVVAGLFGLWKFLPGFQSTPESEGIETAIRNEQALKDEKRLVQKNLSQNAPALLASMMDVIYERPLRANGWRNHSYQWRDDVITSTWKRESGDFELIAAYLNGKDFELDESTGAMIERFDFPAASLPENPSWESLLGNSQKRFEILDLIVQLPGRWTLDSPEKTGTLYRYNRSKLTGTSTGLARAIHTAHAVIGQPLRINMIKVTLGEQFSWEIDGEVYTRAN